MNDAGLIVILGLMNIPVYLYLGKWLFTDWHGFGEAVMYWFKPDMWSWISGDGWEDMVAELKLGIFFAACALLVYGEFQLISVFAGT